MVVRRVNICMTSLILLSMIATLLPPNAGEGEDDDDDDDDDDDEDDDDEMMMMMKILTIMMIIFEGIFLDLNLSFRKCKRLFYLLFSF